jgi:hypothetical protein
MRPMIERHPLDKAADAYDQMISGRVGCSLDLYRHRLRRLKGDTLFVLVGEIGHVHCDR